jgi:hypothetical protein
MHPQQNSDVDDTVTTSIAAAKEDNERQCHEKHNNQPLEQGGVARATTTTLIR